MSTKSSLARLLLPRHPILTRALFCAFCATAQDKTDQTDLGAASACSNLDWLK